MQRILIIEDDTEIGDLLIDVLNDTYEVESAYSGTEGLLLLSIKQFDLIILDMMLPGLTGTEVLKKIRETSQIPIIMLTAVDNKKIISDTLLNGADDYLTKPFDIDELLARISVQFRKKNQLPFLDEPILHYKNIKLDLNSFKISNDEEQIDLSKKETELLKLLIQHPNKVYKKEDIYSLVWDDIYMGDENTVNVHLSNIRKKIAKLDTKNDYIDTIWGIGVKLAE